MPLTGFKAFLKRGKQTTEEKSLPTHAIVANHEPHKTEFLLVKFNHDNNTYHYIHDSEQYKYDPSLSQEKLAMRHNGAIRSLLGRHGLLKRNSSFLRLTSDNYMLHNKDANPYAHYKRTLPPKK